jgi:cytochrome c oxidase subunit 2
MGQFPLMPEQASKHAYDYDFLFWTITGLTVFFTIIVVLIVLYMVSKYRTGSKASRKGQMDSHLGLELTWTAIPLVLAIGIFFWATWGFMKQREMPEDATEIFVIGKQWMWHIQHMNGIRENNELHVPVNTPIKLTMISQDVLHAMYLPEMRTQYHVVPGRYTALHFTPTKIGEYKMLCAMHCGTQHSEMVGKVFVMSEKDYAEWLERGGNRFKHVESMVEAGHDLFTTKGCGNCHTDADNERAPSLYGLIGRTRRFTNGSSAVADEGYVRESILEPYDRITQGYINTMTAYKGQLTEEQVLQIVEYIKSLGTDGGAPGAMRPYEQPVREPADREGAPQNATDTANRRRSAPATQFEQRGGVK